MVVRKMVEDETGRVLQRGVETDSDGQEELPDDWRITADVIRETGRRGTSGRKGDEETWW